MRLFLVLLLVALIVASQPTARIEMRECANCGGSCGITPHTFWLQWDHAETYVQDGMEVTEVPMYAMCSRCGYSFYIEHVVMGGE
jgi:ribosomal protein S27AE